MQAASAIVKVNYNQSELYLAYGIDTIIIRSSGIDAKEHILSPTIKIINELGFCIQSTRYCQNGNLLEVEFYSRKGNIVKKSSYDYECNGTKSSETIYVYTSGLLSQKLISNNLKTYKLTDSWKYDIRDRIIGHTNYRYDDPNWTEHIRFDSLANKSFLTRVSEYGELDSISSSESLYNQRGQLTEVRHRQKHRVTSIYTYSYDKYNQLIREFGSGFPSEKNYADRQYFYSDKCKLDSSWSMANVELNIYNKTYFEYDTRGLLIKETYYDNRNNNAYIKSYTYK